MIKKLLQRIKGKDVQEKEAQNKKGKSVKDRAREQLDKLDKCITKQQMKKA